ncbi:MAG: CHAT domain-containing protein, partial [Nitrosomonas sp.]|nr:CHAT domain-containing protein [Nitrosomonas sp.]
QNDNDQMGILPGEILLDQDFNRETFKSVVQAGYPVLHIASHFKLQLGDGSASKLLLGNGDTLNLDEFRRDPAFKLHGVDLLTLSACETAVGDKGAGGEVESFAVMAQYKGANSVLASLWRVEDESTALLMKRFYRLRSGETPLSKAEALRKAQIAMLNGDLKAKESGHDFRHPYFWAPFVMMGNWL